MPRPILDERQFTKFMDRTEIENTVQKIADQLNKTYEGQSVILVCVLKGAIVFLADLVRHLKFDTRVEFVRLAGHGKTKTSMGTVTFIKDIQTNVNGKHVLIVEEIIDSGRTLKFLYDRIQRSEPASLEIVTLLDKPTKRVVEVPVKYVGKTTSDQFLVGYGLDLEEKCRNVADIYYLKYPN